VITNQDLLGRNKFSMLILPFRQMRSQHYYSLVELARICSRQASLAQTEDVARTLRRMAREYLQEAAKLDDGEIPDIGRV